LRSSCHGVRCSKIGLRDLFDLLTTSSRDPARALAAYMAKFHCVRHTKSDTPAKSIFPAAKAWQTSRNMASKLRYGRLLLLTGMEPEARGAKGAITIGPVSLFPSFAG
jgi:hypothetical protein